MNIQQLRYFLAVCEHCSMSAAAEALYISQPALSGAIKSLEQTFGVRLFERRYHGMVLTPEGETLRCLAEDLLEQTQQIERTMHDMGTQQKVLRLGIPPMIGALLLPRIYRDFFGENPDIQLQIQEEGRQALLSKLQAERLDMVFLPHRTGLDPQLQSQQVGEFETVCCMPKDHPLAVRAGIKPADLEKVPLVLFQDSFFQTEQLKKWFAAAGITPRILLQTGQLSTMKQMIESKQAVGFLFRPLVGEDMAAVPLVEPLYGKISLVWKKNVQFFGSMLRFRNYVTDIMR